ncbi:MAG: DMT family transporter, partial [Eubacteriales bacterium]
MKKGYLYIILAAILFSSMEIALKFISDTFNPIQLTFLRFLFGFAFLLPFALKELNKRKIRLSRNDFAFLALTGFISVVLCMIIFQIAVKYSHANTVAVLFSCNPVFVIIFAFLILREKIYKYTVI